MKTKLIMLDTPIIVSDEEITDVRDVKGKWHIEKGYIINQFPDYLTDLSECKLIIAGIEDLPSIDWNGLEEEFGWVDVEKLADEFYKNYQSRPYAMEKGAWREGFKKAQSLNDKKFSLGDIVFAIEKARLTCSVSNLEGFTFKFNSEQIIQSLQQPKVFDIEVDKEYLSNTNKWKDVLLPSEWEIDTKVRPKITDNSIKIIDLKL